MRHFIKVFCIALAMLIASCGETTPPPPGSESNPLCTTKIDSTVPAWVKQSFTCIEAFMSGTDIIIKTKSLPPYKSYYYGEGNPMFEPIPAGQTPNLQNKIVAQNFQFTISSKPVVNATTTRTMQGPIGVAVNSVVFFNNLNADLVPLVQEFKAFDGGNAHPTRTGIYHYHIEPIKITNNDAKLVGVLRDGFPVYGQKDEDGTVPGNLDSAHGHKHATTFFPNGIYHYHITPVDPYIASDYRGTPGEVTGLPIMQ
jgi:hypothetical protein